MSEQHHQIVVIGGGTAGLTVANLLLRLRPELNVAVIEPSEKHYYQPAWTLVGAGTFDLEDTVREERHYMPQKATWIKEFASGLDPDHNRVNLKNGKSVTYDYLVVCPGIQLDWHKVKGLPETLGKNGVCSNYLFEQATYTWEALQNFNGGTALFTNPNTPIKCGGAPQKIMYLACDHWRKRGILKESDVRFMTSGTVIFGVPGFKEALEKIVDNYGIKPTFTCDLVEVDGKKKIAVFDKLQDGKPTGDQIEVKFDMMHVTPPMSAPDFIKESKLANELGWVDLDKASLQHVRYSNVFGLGDAGGTPNAKTGAAVRKQAPILVNNLFTMMDHKSLVTMDEYTGYSSCPIVTGYDRLLLAEFDYDNNPMPTFPFDQTVERRSMFILKKYMLPWMYWNRMIKGRP
jgi:sulfide:quinone oxidoreductase